MERRWSGSGARSGDADLPARHRHDTRCVDARRGSARRNSRLPGGSRVRRRCDADLRRRTPLRGRTADRHTRRRPGDRPRHQRGHRSAPRPHRHSPVPPELTRLNNRWISSQRRLAALYAQLWVRIYDTVDAAHTPAQMAAVANRLEKLVAAPDAEKAAAGRLELALHVPDCTGGG